MNTFFLMAQTDAAATAAQDAEAGIALISEGQNLETVTTESVAGPETPVQANAPQQAGGGWTMWVMLILIFVVMWFFMIRPQRKQQKELQKFRDGLKKGDKVVTYGGIYGTVAEIDEKTVLMKVDGDTKLRVDKNSLVKDYSTVAQQ